MNSSRIFAYLLAFATVSAATVFRLYVVPSLHSDHPFLTYFAAILFSAWFVGLGPGLFAAAFSTLLVDYFFIDPPNKFLLPDLKLYLFILESIFVSWLGGSRRKALLQLQEEAATLEKRVRTRTADLEESKNRLRRLNEQLIATEEYERRHIAQGLHDHVQQLLVASLMYLQTISEKSNKDRQREDIDKVRGWLREALQSTRSLVFDLSPTVLHECGLAAALEHLRAQMRERYQLRIGLYIAEGVESLPEQFKIFLYRGISELLLNVVKHAKTDHAEVRLEICDGKLRVEVSDEGAGFDPAWMKPKQEVGLGMRSISERVENFGGQLRIESASGRGTSVAMAFPLNRP